MRTVVLCTEPFMNSAATHARAFGRPDYQAVAVQHPLAALGPEEVQQRADAVVDRVVAALTGRGVNFP